MKSKPVTIREDDLDGELKFRTPGENQGQAVEVSYAGLYDGRVLRRSHDRSGGEVTYAVADLSAEEQASHSPIGLNGVPEIDGEWRPALLVEAT